MGWGQILTLKNDPTCSLVPRVVLKYKLHRYGVGFKFQPWKMNQYVMTIGRILHKRQKFVWTKYKKLIYGQEKKFSYRKEQGGWFSNVK